MSIPQAVNGYKAYGPDGLLVGTGAEVTLPSFEAVTAELKGAGIAGVLDIPLVGQFGPQTLGLTFNALTKEGLAMMQSGSIQLEIYGSVQVVNQQSAQTELEEHRVTVTGLLKTANWGTFAIAETMGAEFEIECLWIQYAIDGAVQVEYDKLGENYVVQGIDHLAAKRQAEGGA